MHVLLIWYNTTSLTSISNFSRDAFAFYTLHIFVTNKPPIDYRWVKHIIMHHRFFKRIAQCTWSGNRLNIKLMSYPYRISHHKIRRAEDRVIFIMEILYSRKFFILRRIFLDLFLVKFYVTKIREVLDSLPYNASLCWSDYLPHQSKCWESYRVIIQRNGKM